MSHIDLQIVKPNRPDVVQLLSELDVILRGGYPPESNHILSVEQLMHPSITFIVAEIDGQAVGCGAIRRDAEGYAEVKRMYVKPEHRGKGIAYRLLSKLESLATSEGISILRLETGIYQHEARALYERFGFTQRGIFGEYFEDPLSLFYEKHIG
jgi:putative acetyltransferase